MRKIEEGIIISNDIKRILEGNNALGYSYKDKGMVIPSEKFISLLRKDLEKDLDRIFDGNVTIIEEDDMYKYLNDAISDVYGRLPHCISR